MESWIERAGATIFFGYLGLLALLLSPLLIPAAIITWIRKDDVSPEALIEDSQFAVTAFLLSVAVLIAVVILGS